MIFQDAKKKTFQNDSNQNKLIFLKITMISLTISTLSIQARTSDSLNEGLPIKMTREKFQRKLYFFYEIDSRVKTPTYPQKPFSHWTSTN